MGTAMRGTTPPSAALTVTPAGASLLAMRPRLRTSFVRGQELVHDPEVFSPLDPILIGLEVFVVRETIERKETQGHGKGTPTHQGVRAAGVVRRSEKNRRRVSQRLCVWPVPIGAADDRLLSHRLEETCVTQLRADR